MMGINLELYAKSIIGYYYFEDIIAVGYVLDIISFIKVGLMDKHLECLKDHFEDMVAIL